VRLTSLAVRDWRNLHAAELWTDARFVVLHGDNAQGKTNLLEAVWLLATLRSFREARPARWVRQGAKAARIQAVTIGGMGTRRLDWRLVGGQRRLAIDGAAPSSLLPWFDALRAVLFCPEHISIVRGEPSERRAFLDRAAFTARPEYLDIARDYARAVRQKAALLREGRGSPALLAPWNARLVDLGARVAMARWRVLAELQGPFQALHRRIAGSAEEVGHVTLAMRGLGGEAEGIEVVRARLETALGRHQADELRRGRVLVGPHRDDVVITVQGRPARAFASQGQARSIVLALKLAELEAARQRGQSPLLLLDDLSGELDRGRMQRLVEVLGELDNQVWVTTTDAAYLGPLPAGAAVRWRVSEGQVFGETPRPAGAGAAAGEGGAEAPSEGQEPPGSAGP